MWLHVGSRYTPRQAWTMVRRARRVRRAHDLAHIAWARQLAEGTK
jgi:hypothetical protein